MANSKNNSFFVYVMHRKENLGGGFAQVEDLNEVLIERLNDTIDEYAIYEYTTLEDGSTHIEYKDLVIFE